MVTKPKTDEQEITHKLHKLVFLLDKQADVVVEKECYITLSQFLLLRALYHNQDCAQREAAEFLGQTQAAVSKQTENLIEKRLVLRKENPENRRENILTITEAGKKVFLKAKSVLNNHFEGTYKVLDAKERNQLAALLSKLTEASQPQNLK